jgi:hypothetical protein
MIIAFLLGLRVTGPLTEIQTVPFLEKESLDQFVRSDSPSVVFFGSSRSDFEFAALSIYRFRKQLKFGFSNPESGTAFNLTTFPCVAAFLSGFLVNAGFSGSSPIAFGEYCDGLLFKMTNRKALLQAEDLRRLFLSPSTFLLGIDAPSPPADYRNDVPFCSVKLHLFKFFNLSVRAGYYVYRGIDRQLVACSRNYHLYLKSPLVELSAVNFSAKLFLTGVVVDPALNDTVAELQFQVMHKLANKFVRQFMIAPIVGPLSRAVVSAANLMYLNPPLIAVWKGDINATRWALQGPVLWNATVLEQWLDAIERGEQPIQPISQMDPKPNELTCLNFAEKTFNTSAVILVAQGGFARAPAYKSLFKQARANLTQVKFFSFDIGQNDLPPGLPAEQPPYIAIAKAGEEFAVIPFGQLTLSELLDLARAYGL